MAKILITGTNGGFGRLTFSALKSKGHQIAASMRDITGKNKKAADELKAAGATVVELDVTKDASVDQAVKSVIDSFGGLDVVINNAGVGVLGLQEAFTPDDWRKIFEVNVFGVQRVDRAVLPHMRQKGDGLLIHISSLLGRITVPFYGPYNASKWALEALCENYRTEVSQSGVEVCIVEPGGYPTTFIDNLVRPSDASRNAGYGPMGAMAEPFLENFEKNLAANPAQDPNNVALAIADLVGKPKGQRPFRTIVDKLGMGSPIEEYNAALARITQGIYGAFGIGHLLQVKK